VIERFKEDMGHVALAIHWKGGLLTAEDESEETLSSIVIVNSTA
jgi:hypothetical protein